MANERYARQIVAAFPVGKQVSVHYSPGDPADAILAPGIDGFDLSCAMFAVPFNMGMCILWVMAMRELSGSNDKLPVCGFIVNDDGFRIRIRTSRATQVRGMFAFFFVEVIVVAIGVVVLFGPNPPLNVSMLAWAVLPAGASIYFGWR